MLLTVKGHFLAWVYYLIGAVGLMAVWWFLTRKISHMLTRNMVRLVVAVILIMPYPVLPDQSFLAPAVIMSALEGLFVDGGDFARAGVPLVIAILVALLLYILLDLIWRYGLRKRWLNRQQRKAQVQQQLAEHDALMHESKTADG